MADTTRMSGGDRHLEASGGSRSDPDGPVLLIGAGGMLGRAWRGLLDDQAIAYVPVTRAELDLSRPQTIEVGVHDGYRLVVNCAAWTDVDGAETHDEAALAVNGTGVGLLAERCARIGVPLIHYSTDYVFDGRARSPYRTDHPRSPINAYGRSKANGELAFEASGCRGLIIRTSWLYAPWGHNFVRTMAGLVRRRDTVRVVDDQRGRPTSCEHLAGASLRLINAGAQGVYHVTDGGQCTWFELAQRIAELVGSDCRVEPCGTDAFPRPARRPAHSVLDLSKTERLIGPMPAWQSNLAGVVANLEPVAL